MHMPGGLDWVVILVIVLLLFGPSKLPQLAKGLGESVKEFKEAAKSEDQKAQEAKRASGQNPPEGPKTPA